MHGRLLDLLEPDGVMVVFSMNNKPWDNIYEGKRMHRIHMRLRPRIRKQSSRGRSTSHVGNDVLVLVASSTLSAVSTSTIADVDPIPDVECADWSLRLPSADLWQSTERT